MWLNRFLCKLKPLFTFYFSRPQWNLISQGKSECKFNEHYLILKLICRQYFVKFKTSFMWTHLITSLLSYVDHQLVKKCSDEKFRLSVSFKMHHIFFSSLFSFHSLQIHSLFNNFEIDYVPKQERKWRKWGKLTQTLNRPPHEIEISLTCSISQ